jgi:hypothetical protein
MTLFLDMDGVLDDFVKGANKLGIVFGNDRHFLGNRKNGYAKINKKGINFWTDLEWMPEGEKLFRYCCANFKDIQILSSLTRSEDCLKGKVIWCKKNLLPIAKEYGIKLKLNFVHNKKHKEKFSGKDNILIDDDLENIRIWKNKNAIHYLNFSNTKERLKLI